MRRNKIKVENTIELTQEDRDSLVVSSLETEKKRPTCRADCSEVSRPCPYILCKHNMFLDIKDNGSIRYTQNTKDPLEVKHVEINGEKVMPSCSLDIAEQFPEGLSCDAIGTLLGGISRETVRLVSKKSTASISSRMSIMGYTGEVINNNTTGTTLDALECYIEDSKLANRKAKVVEIRKDTENEGKVIIDVVLVENVRVNKEDITARKVMSTFRVSSEYVDRQKFMIMKKFGAKTIEDLRDEEM